ncbi:hypothetical protein B5S31_g3428 [[Candida] boidinii]|nr:hypothetical protein B5S31_g3428 [[Candida] boidinii]
MSYTKEEETNNLSVLIKLTRTNSRSSNHGRPSTPLDSNRKNSSGINSIHGTPHVLSKPRIPIDTNVLSNGSASDEGTTAGSVSTITDPYRNDDSFMLSTNRAEFYNTIHIPSNNNIIINDNDNIIHQQISRETNNFHNGMNNNNISRDEKVKEAIRLARLLLQKKIDTNQIDKSHQGELNDKFDTMIDNLNIKVEKRLSSSSKIDPSHDNNNNLIPSDLMIHGNSSNDLFENGNFGIQNNNNSNSNSTIAGGENSFVREFKREMELSSNRDNFIIPSNSSTTSFSDYQPSYNLLDDLKTAKLNKSQEHLTLGSDTDKKDVDEQISDLQLKVKKMKNKMLNDTKNSIFKNSIFNIEIIKKVFKNYGIYENYVVESFESLISLMDNFLFISSFIKFKRIEKLQYFITQISKLWVIIILITLKNLCIRLIKLFKLEKLINSEIESLKNLPINSITDLYNYNLDIKKIKIQSEKITVLLEIIGNVNELLFYLIEILQLKLPKYLSRIIGIISWLMSFYRLSRDSVDESDEEKKTDVNNNKSIITNKKKDVHELTVDEILEEYELN